MLITTSNIFQIVIALGLLNVWILRFNKETAYRGGIAKTLKEEFVAYDLPVWSCYAVGFLKILSAILLIVGVWIPQIVLPSGILVLFLMFAAVTMHLMIRDPLLKAMPALTLLLMSGAIVLIRMP